MIGSALSALVALAFVGLGIGAYAAPGALSKNYGLPAATPTEFAYLRAIGTRDGVLGVLIACFLLQPGSRSALRTTVGVSVLAAAGDFAAVASVRGTAAKGSLAIHAGGFAGLVALWLVLGSER